MGAILIGMSKSAKSGVKSAYELALERLDHEGIERPRADALSADARERMAEVRSRAEARLAELEILHRKAVGAVKDSAERDKLEREYVSDRRAIEERRERDVARLRTPAG
jgi:hypothetical protein